MNQLVCKTYATLLRCSVSFAIKPNLSQTCKQTNLRSLSLTPLVLSEQNFRPSEELAKERYDVRATEDVEKKRARLLYQSRKRGMLENGVILASFADKFLNKLDAEELDQYDRLINLPTNDWDIYYWATKTKPTPPEYETPVMQKLREHLHSKVSSESDIIQVKNKKLTAKRSSDLVLPVYKKSYELNVDVRNVSLVNYAEELFDNRIQKLARGKEVIKNMTDWRKEYFVRRLKRTISSPISLRHMNEDKLEKVYTQDVGDRKIGRESLKADIKIDTKYERSMKHHNFLQYLLGANFTDKVEDYDFEAEAWSEMIWHRNYGSSDVRLAPSSIKCSGCGSKLHCCDHGLNGYIPKELFAKLVLNETKEHTCQRCKFSSVYGAKLGEDVSAEKFINSMKELKDKPPAVVCLLVDLTDFPSSIWPGLVDLIGHHHKLLVVGNKIDLLPFDAHNMIERVTISLKKNLFRLRPNEKNLYVDHVMVMSARTGFAVESLANRIMSHLDEPKDVYLIGSSNSGKSTLFNALLQSNLSAIREGDLISRISKVDWPEHNEGMLRFPIKLVEGWEIQLQNRRLERVERNVGLMQRSMLNATKFRQATMPHFSMLINRAEYLPVSASSVIIPDDTNKEPLFTDDHPLKHISNNEPLSASPEKFEYNGFVYHSPSAYTKEQIHDLLTLDEKLEVFPHETIMPRKYSLRPMQSILIAGLARIDLVTSVSNVLITIFASRYLPIHVISTRKADHFYTTFLGSSYLGVPFGDEERLKAWPRLKKSKYDYAIRGNEHNMGSADIVLSSIGWALVEVRPDQECIVRAYTPEARGIFKREPPLIYYGRKVVSGRKIRDTPMFDSREYNIRRYAMEK